MNFASDNAAPAADAVLDAIREANRGHVLGYGNDAFTARAKQRLADVFERDCAIFLVSTGTAANALALAAMTPPWGAVIAHEEAHIATDECGAPEFFTNGGKLVTVPSDDAKLTPEAAGAVLDEFGWGGAHHVEANALSIAQASEAGTTYSVAEVEALARLAHDRGLGLHMDGARFANALVYTGATPAEMSWKAGVDVLSLGFTKGGAMAAEAILVFDERYAAHLEQRRKRAGHLFSKHRYLAAQILAMLDDGLWLHLAAIANTAAARLAAGLAAAGHAPVYAAETNVLFAALPKSVDLALRQAGAQYYARRPRFIPKARVGADRISVRLVTSHATTEAEIEQFLGFVKRAA